MSGKASEVTRMLL